MLPVACSGSVAIVNVQVRSSVVPFPAASATPAARRAVYVAPLWVVDFEVVVASDVKPWGSTGLTIDPGLIYVGEPVALGLRAKFDVSANANFGLIPLIHKGIVDIGEANWFVEAAFPITATRGEGYALAAVAHTGFAF